MAVEALKAEGRLYQLAATTGGLGAERALRELIALEVAGAVLDLVTPSSTIAEEAWTPKP